MAPRKPSPPSFAVTWREQVEGPLYAGELTLGPEKLQLGGTARAGELATLRIPYGEIEDVHVGRTGSDRIRGRISLVVDLSNGSTLHIGSVSGQVTIVELADLIAERLSRGQALLRP